MTGSLLVGLTSAVIMIVGGATPAFFDLLAGSLAGIKPYLGIFRFSTYLFGMAWIVQLLGFVALTRLLVRTGDEVISPLALAVTVVVTVLGTLEVGFVVGVTTWAVSEAASTGITPELYTVLSEGLLGRIQFVYTVLGFLSQAAFAVALLKTRLLPRSVSLTALVWALIWLALDPGIVGIPAILLLMPAGIGTALLTTDQPLVTTQPPLQKEAVDG